MKHIAHARKVAAGWDVHPLEEHLRKVGVRAAESAAKFGAPEWARTAGIWHDLGKYRTAFQEYIKTKSGYDPEAHIEGGGLGRVDHSTAGALYAADHLSDGGRILAYLIAGHHAGLPDWSGNESGAATLEARLDNAKIKKYLDDALSAPIPGDILAVPDNLLESKPLGGRRGLHLWVRMLFSCLVDADFLDTEGFMDPSRADLRRGGWSMGALKEKFDAWMNNMEVSGRLDSKVNLCRERVLKDCRSAAADAPGVYTLTAPTGAGKTLAGMAFALEHATTHKKDRIIVALPYTSIIEQTADQYRKIFGDAVLEHHSNLDPDKPANEDQRSRLAAENWDVPVVVTTNVQLFESCFSSRTSRCRKLHNMVNTVIILDEAQMLPPDILQPIIDTVRLLTEHYGATVVLSTATQPALGTVKDAFGATILRGLDDTREIISDVDELFSDLERVKVDIPADLASKRSWEDLATEIQTHDQVLAVVNRRQDARDLHRLLPEGAVHLSARMCPAHRFRVIRDIKTALKGRKKPLRVVSTQLVEAGVDIDFPVVYRALAGIDSIAQAAGRCNREGNLPEGRVVVFVPPTDPPPGLLRRGAEAAVRVLGQGKADGISRAHHAPYFKHYYAKTNPDSRGITNLLTQDAGECMIQFRTAARRFRFIQNDTVPVIVNYACDDHEDAAGRESLSWTISKLREEGPQRWIMRRLQPYVVQVYEHELVELDAKNAVEEVYQGYWRIISPDGYDDTVGLKSTDEMPTISPERYYT